MTTQRIIGNIKRDNRTIVRIEEEVFDMPPAPGSPSSGGAKPPKEGRQGEQKGEIILPGEFHLYEGRNVDKAPEILQAGKIIAPAFYIAQRRLEAKTPEDITLWHDKWYDTSDLIAYDSERNPDNVKLILSYDSQFRLTKAGEFCLNLINPNETLVNNGVNLSNGRYEQIEGEGVFPMKRSELAGILEKGMRKTQTLDSRLWRRLLRHQDEVPPEFAFPDLHKNYIDLVYSSYKERFAKNAKLDELELMGVYLSSVQAVPHLKAWYLGGLGDGSGARGRTYLGGAYGRFSGVSARGAVAEK